MIRVGLLLAAGMLLTACAGGDVRNTHEFNLIQLRKDDLAERHAERYGAIAAVQVQGPYAAARQAPPTELYSLLRPLTCDSWSGQNCR